MSCRTQAAEDVPFIPSWVGKNTAVYGAGVEGVEDTLDPSFIFRFWMISKNSVVRSNTTHPV